MKNNVVNLPVITKLDLQPDRLLNAALGKLDTCIIIGHDKDGNDYFASTKADAAVVIYHLERGKHNLMKIVDEYEG